MADINKLKNRARREEQRQNWPLAIELYTRALRATERSSTVATDFSLYNRIGDIHLRLGEVETAVSCYEQAIARYAEHDLHTSAIALCNKILRIQPSRISGYQRLGELQLETGLLAEARVNYLRYATELLTRGRQDQAYTSLADYVERTGDLNSALRFAGALVANDRSAEALDLLLRLKHQAESGGRGAEALERPIAAIQRFKDRGPAVAAEYEAAVAVGELEAEMTEALEERREGGGGTIALLEAELDAAVGVTSESERAGVTSESAPLEEELAPEEEPWVVEPAAEEMAGIRPVAAEEPADEIEEEPEAEEEAEPEPEAEAEPWVVEPVAEEEPAPSGEEVTPETGPA
ncbi:MAG: tetratricopeptide repeat protein, partial [Gemmatimonadota bacterium]